MSTLTPLHNYQITDQHQADMNYIRSILPTHYIIRPSKHKGSVNCISDIGIRHKIDADDDEHWEYFVKAVQKHFGDRFMEIDHITNFCHTNFTVYLKNPE